MECMLTDRDVVQSVAFGIVEECRKKGFDLTEIVRVDVQVNGYEVVIVLSKDTPAEEWKGCCC